MAWSQWNPNGLEDGMIVRSISRPSKAFRVAGLTARGRATFVAISPGSQSVMNGSAKNYRPEDDDEARERIGPLDDVADGDDIDRDDVDRPGDAASAPEDRDREPDDDDDDGPGVPELCVRMQDAVARVADGECDVYDAAAIVAAAAALNDAVVRRL